MKSSKSGTIRGIRSKSGVYTNIGRWVLMGGLSSDIKLQI